MDKDFKLNPIGVVESKLSKVKDAPCQGSMGAPEAWITNRKEVIDGMKDVNVGDKVIVLTWLHLADRSTLSVHRKTTRAIR